MYDKKVPRLQLVCCIANTVLAILKIFLHVHYSWWNWFMLEHLVTVS